MAAQVPILRILGGIFFVLAGLAYYLGVTLASSASLIFIAAGAAVILLALLRHRASAGDVAIFIIGLLVFGVFLTPGIGAGYSASQSITHTVGKTALSTQHIDLVASANVGNVNVFYSSKSDLAYQVNFTRSTMPFGFFAGLPSTSLTNQTEGSVFTLNATAHSYDISIAIGTGYTLDVNANSGTGNVNLRGLSGERLGLVSLQTGTGNINGNLTTLSVEGVILQTGTGNANLFSNHLAASGPSVPIVIRTGTGSVDFDVKLVNGTAVSIDASTGLGGVNHNLQGFSVSSQSSRSSLTANAGDVSTAATSFLVQATAGTGSVTLNAKFLG